MTTALDIEFLDEVAGAVDEIGLGEAVLVTYPGLSINAIDSVVNPGVAVEYAVRVTPPQRIEDYKDSALAVTRTAFVVVMPAKGLSVAPARTSERNTRLRVTGATYNILRVQEISGGDVPCGWVLWLEAAP